MQIKDLVVTGDARILGNLYAKDGNVSGGGSEPSLTYKLTKSGSTITLTGSDGSTSSVTDADTNTTYTLSSLGAAPQYQYSTSDLTAGSSSLATGVLYFVYE